MGNRTVLMFRKTDISLPEACLPKRILRTQVSFVLRRSRVDKDPLCVRTIINPSFTNHQSFYIIPDCFRMYHSIANSRTAAASSQSKFQS